MAKDRDGIYVDNPKPDIYLALIILTTASLIVASVIMWLEYSGLQLPG